MINLICDIISICDYKSDNNRHTVYVILKDAIKI